MDDFYKKLKEFVDLKKGRDVLRDQLTSVPGVSDVGIEARRGDVREKGVVSHGYGRSMKDPNKHLEMAKKIHHALLHDLKSEKQPDLPKSEEKVSMPKKDFIKEHKNLVHVLNEGSQAERTAEAKEQGNELKEEMKKVSAISLMPKKKKNSMMMGTGSPQQMQQFQAASSAYGSEPSAAPQSGSSGQSGMSVGGGGGMSKSGKLLDALKPVKDIIHHIMGKKPEEKQQLHPWGQRKLTAESMRFDIKREKHEKQKVQKKDKPFPVQQDISSEPQKITRGTITKPGVITGPLMINMRKDNSQANDSFSEMNQMDSSDFRKGDEQQYHIHDGKQRITSKPMNLRDINARHGSVQKLESAGFRLIPHNPAPAQKPNASLKPIK